MTQATIAIVAEYAAFAAIAITFIVTGSMNIRARYDTEANRKATAALEEAKAAREEAARQLAEAQQLAARFREHREWIEAHPEEFRAALLAQLTASDPADVADEPERCPKCCSPIEDHIDPATGCAIWARGPDGEVLTFDR